MRFYMYMYILTCTCTYMYMYMYMYRCTVYNVLHLLHFLHAISLSPRSWEPEDGKHLQSPTPLIASWLVRWAPTKELLTVVCDCRVIIAWCCVCLIQCSPIAWSGTSRWSRNKLSLTPPLTLTMETASLLCCCSSERPWIHVSVWTYYATLQPYSTRKGGYYMYMYM